MMVLKVVGEQIGEEDAVAQVDLCSPHVLCV